MDRGPILLVSACLVGQACRYDGRIRATVDAVLAGWVRRGRAVAICPECAGGLPVPRPPAEIQNGDGAGVWMGRSRVRTRDGRDVTAAFLRGGRMAARLIRRHGIRVGVFKNGSPSCGVTYIYDGTFAGRFRSGCGVAAAHLAAMDVQVFPEERVREAIRAAIRSTPTRLPQHEGKLTGSGKFDILGPRLQLMDFLREAVWPN